MDDRELPDTVLLADEWTALQAFVDAQRAEIRHALDGLTQEQARRRLVASRTTLLGLVKHAAFVERVWFDVGLAGRSRQEVGIPENHEDSFELTADDTTGSVLAALDDAVRSARERVAGLGPDDLVQHNRRSPLTLRWTYLHLVRELARHAGHADILREQLLQGDGSP